MKLQEKEIKELRNYIREIILNSDDLKDITLVQKENLESIKKECYDNLIELKLDFDSQKEVSVEDSLKKVERTINSLTKLKNFLNKSL